MKGTRDTNSGPVLPLSLVLSGISNLAWLCMAVRGRAYLVSTVVKLKH